MTYRYQNLCSSLYGVHQPQHPPPDDYCSFLWPIFMPVPPYAGPPWPIVPVPSGLLTEYYSFPTLIPLLSLLKSYTPLSILSYII